MEPPTADISFWNFSCRAQLAFSYLHPSYQFLCSLHFQSSFIRILSIESSVHFFRKFSCALNFGSLCGVEIPHSQEEEIWGLKSVRPFSYCTCSTFLHLTPLTSFYVISLVLLRYNMSNCLVFFFSSWLHSISDYKFGHLLGVRAYSLQLFCSTLASLLPLC